MRGKLWFIGGVAVGFVLGARAGREKYDELVLNARKVMDHPTVQEAAGVAQAQANRLYVEGRERLSHTRLGEKLNGHDHHDTTSSTGGGSLAGAGVTGSGSTPTGGTANGTAASTASGSGTSVGRSSSTGKGASPASGAS
ncbi:hypothetical protein O7632_12540 [Solwaraspora sp. WMMD406]|uniref:hypothetical protein n=1 Tax=Solwaraspora sp. WMMD406 TaxID=3016095 RepID=UPI002416D9A2|nr:hypothetical protein [Solwaraspora sp. WMMD406]MDG4764921.1 hypothetical protein [Solwaraspora sp. WMMD406]